MNEWLGSFICVFIGHKPKDETLDFLFERQGKDGAIPTECKRCGSGVKIYRDKKSEDHYWIQETYHERLREEER